MTARAIYRDVFSDTPIHITEYCTETMAAKTPTAKSFSRPAAATNSIVPMMAVPKKTATRSRKIMEVVLGKNIV